MLGAKCGRLERLYKVSGQHLECSFIPLSCGFLTSGTPSFEFGERFSDESIKFREDRDDRNLEIGHDLVDRV